MPTLKAMLKRFLTIASGALVGTALAYTAANYASAWGLWPNRELDRSSSYVKQVMELVADNYVDGSKAGYDQLTKSALHGLLESLDPHSEFLEARDFRELEEDMNAEFGGIGVQVEMREGRVVVISPIAGTPGDRAGIQRGDAIMAVDGKRLDKAAMNDVVDHLRGKPRSKVTVQFYRPSTKREFEVTLVREIIKVESVRDVRLLPDGIGYLQLTQFSERTGDEFEAALAKLKSQGMTALVLDLRNNPGGLLDAAVAVAEPFFNRGELIVYTQGRNPKDREEFLAESRRPALAVPIVVLINSGTASAAEIVAGALRDTRKAVIVGERSFGKGSVQSIFQLKNGEGLRLTTARYYTPSGVTIHEKGIEPQVDVVMTPEEDSQLRLQRARSDVSDTKEFTERFGFTPIPDRQLDAAVEVAHGLQAWTRRAVATR
ncbi:MAG: S41 family peptidase [Opitutaceae bacterium]|nr:S41 family peptidase [Opitutaceae bacterium]